MVEDPRDWAVAVLATVIIGVGILVCLAFRSRRRVSRIVKKRQGWTSATFWKGVDEAEFPKAYRDVFLRLLQERVAAGFPVLPTDSLAFYDIGTYLSAIEDEFVLELCERVRIHPPTQAEIGRLPIRRDAILSVKDLVQALGSWFKMKADSSGR